MSGLGGARAEHLEGSSGNGQPHSWLAWLQAEGCDLLVPIREDKSDGPGHREGRHLDVQLDEGFQESMD